MSRPLFKLPLRSKYFLIFSTVLAGCSIHSTFAECPTVGPGPRELSPVALTEVANKIVALYSPEVAKARGGPLHFIQRFESDWVQREHTNLFNGEYRNLRMVLEGSTTGGYMTLDGYAALICHEFGHAIGGYPGVGLKQNSNYPSGNSYEGQADYFAASRCLARFFSKDNNRALLRRMAVSPEIKWACDASYKPGLFTQPWPQVDPNTADEQSAICQRIAMAGLALARYGHWISCGDPDSFPRAGQRETKITNVTYVSYGSNQCRFDTFFQGALCNEDRGLPFDLSGQKGGTCFLSSGVGTRPRCWFAGIQ